MNYNLEECKQHVGGKSSRERDHQEQQGLCMWMIPLWTSEPLDWVVWIGSEQRLLKTSFEHGNESSDSLKCKEVLVQLQAWTTSQGELSSVELLCSCVSYRRVSSRILPGLNYALILREFMRVIVDVYTLLLYITLKASMAICKHWPKQGCYQKNVCEYKKVRYLTKDCQ